jgi:hypothetical protein
VLAIAAAAVLARLPLLTRPLSPDEGGFLMVAAQWAPGTSLYGDYWVDRPPLLITLFQLADSLGGGAIALRLLGAAWVGSSVLLAAALAHTALRLDARRPGQPGRVPVYASLTAAVLLVSPLFGASEIDGELLAVPFVLAGILAVLKGHTGQQRHAVAWWVAAGILAAAAVAVKQNMLEVFVAAAVVLLGMLRRHPSRAAWSAVAFGVGATLAASALLAWAADHGTSPSALWDSIVTFRIQASNVIARSAPSTTNTRALGVAGAFLASGALGLAVLGLAPLRRGGVVRWPSLIQPLAAAVLVWELVGVVAGGSYWLHYLVGTVPGLVLATAAATSAGRARRIALGAALTYAGIVASAGVAVAALSPIGTPPADLAVEHYLSGHERPGDSGVVAFGDPALLQAAHLPSPYPELWSLPVRVRDPQLVELTRVLTSVDRPTWVVVDGNSLATWGVDPSLAQPVLDRDYRLEYVAGDWHVYHTMEQP